ncbi:MAG TPA: CDP-alcohol phosphatidyltransferase family protein [Solirubrobacteraceae bacterium]|nr:CDP-alcohol phosphatidyltransferase family protein [Solirubrobacteraceae bacterium]
MPEALTDGERWTREELERLRRDRFAPRAVARFLDASFARSAAVREERPDLVRQSRRWIAAGALAYVAAPGLAGKRAALAWWAAVALMLDWHLGMLETPEGEPRPLGPADALTLARAWLVPVAAQRPTASVYLVAALTDALDGPVARATGPTRAGRDLEALVDACFTTAALRGLASDGRLPRAAIAAEATRVGAGFGYAFTTYFARAQPPDDALLHAARASTVLRVAGIVAAASGKRRTGTALVAVGCAWSVSLAAGSRASSRAGSATPAA